MKGLLTLLFSAQIAVLLIQVSNNLTTSQEVCEFFWRGRGKEKEKGKRRKEGGRKHHQEEVCDFFWRGEGGEGNITKKKLKILLEGQFGLSQNDAQYKAVVVECFLILILILFFLLFFFLEDHWPRVFFFWLFFLVRVFAEKKNSVSQNRFVFSG